MTNEQLYDRRMNEAQDWYESLKAKNPNFKFVGFRFGWHTEPDENFDDNE